MLNRSSRRFRLNQSGSGTAIGVAIMFPMLMTLIVVIQMLSESARIEQSIQAAANRAARAASLCCYYTGGDDGGAAVAHASLQASVSADAYNRIHCNNDVVGSSVVAFIDVAGNHVRNDTDSRGNLRPVPPGGTVHVIVTCQIPPQALGGFGIPGLDVERRVEGVATIDPYRYRHGA